MALKSVVDTLEELDETLRSHYKVHTDGKFYLETDKGDVGALVRAKDHEKNLRVAAETALGTANEQVTALTTDKDALTNDLNAEKAKKGDDTQALEASWQTKLEAEKTARASDNAALTSEVERLLVTNVANGLAHEISTIPEMFAESVISKRLKAEKGADGQYFTRVLDEAGTPSAKTLDEFKQELLANDKYGAILIAGKGTGGGAGGSGSGGGAAEKKYLEHSDTELSELRRTDRAKYDRLKEAHQKETQTAGASS